MQGSTRLENGKSTSVLVTVKPHHFNCNHRQSGVYNTHTLCHLLPSLSSRVIESGCVSVIVKFVPPPRRAFFANRTCKAPSTRQARLKHDGICLLHGDVPSTYQAIFTLPFTIACLPRPTSQRYKRTGVFTRQL